MEKETATITLGILNFLLCLFMVLKLLKLIAWTWWLVLIPLWIELGLFVFNILFIIILMIIDNKRDQND